MKPRFPHAGAGENAPESGSTAPREPRLLIRPESREDRACCCPARPVVRAIMPPTPERRHSVDLLLCGHHYRVSRPALAAAGASIVTLSGSEDAAAALLDVGTGTRPASDARRPHHGELRSWRNREPGGRVGGYACRDCPFEVQTQQPDFADPVQVPAPGGAAGRGPPPAPAGEAGLGTR